MAIDSKRIARNTLFLYARMILTMGVSLYTSRVILEVLGVEDYGLYFTIFSIIGLMSFLTGTLSGGTSRFITFELGTGDLNKLNITFGTAFLTHLMLAGVIVILGETLGLWYANDILKVPETQKSAAIYVYQISVLSTFIGILQVPFVSEVIAHERMNIFAYLGIFEAFSKLGIVYILLYVSYTKIILLAWLNVGVSFIIFSFYLIYTKRNFKEVTWRLKFSKKIFKSMMGFSGWNLLANICNTLGQQGVIMLFNFFFAPVVVAAQAISNQITNAVTQFINNIRQAVNPQIIKLYADQEYNQSMSLTLKSSEYLFYLLLLLGVPVIMVMPKLLSIWLTEVPEYTVAFARLSVVNLIVDNFNAAFYTPMVAANKISKNAIWGSVLCISQFIILWILFHFDLGPLWAKYLGIISTVIFSFIIKPYILYKDVNYSFPALFSCIFNCIKAAIPIILINLLIYFIIPQKYLWQSIVVALSSVLIVIITAYNIVDKAFRLKIKTFVLKKISAKSL